MRAQSRARRKANDPALSAAVLHLLRHISKVSLAWLCRCAIPGMESSLVDNFYCVRETPLMAEHPEQNELPWPVQLVLGNFSRKHCFGQRFPLQPSELRHCTALLRRRICWSFHFRNNHKDGHRKLLRTEICPFKGVPPAEIDCFCSQLSQAAHQAVKSASASAFRFELEVPQFVKYAMQWLKIHKMEVAISDKDGTFVLLRDNVLDQLISSELVPPHYVPYSFLKSAS